MFQKVLIANRGEIACRIIRTLRQLGITSVAIYSSADKESLHVKQADEAYYIGDHKHSNPYLNCELILQAAKEAKVDAIHPGYGFLSEQPVFSNACAKAGIVFIGPDVKALEVMGSKQLAKLALASTDVPLTPGYHGKDQDEAHLAREAKKIGFPVLLKAAAGGGGKGMRKVSQESDFLSALISAKREAVASFADETMIIEKCIENARHIEVQIMADTHGHTIALFERDCSLQRRHQKIIEEATAPHLSPTLRQQLFDAAITVAKTIQYQGAGTIEFLVTNDDQFYFMEMNTRLQVEHPVTEMITGIDLVAWQIIIAAGAPLPLKAEDIKAKGHAIECRIYAEDPHTHLPSTGVIQFLKEPNSTHIRLDTGIELGSEVGLHFDPMLAKLIALGENREQCTYHLLQALQSYCVGGVKTNIPFLQAILQHPAFTKAAITVDFLDKETISLPCIANEELAFYAAGVDYAIARTHLQDGLAKDTFAFQLHLASSYKSRYEVGHEYMEIEVTPISKDRVRLKKGDLEREVSVTLDNQFFQWLEHQCKLGFWVQWTNSTLTLYPNAIPIKITKLSHQATESLQQQQAQLTAPMPATVVAVLKKKGDKIKSGERLMVLEAMKMEHTIHATMDGLLSDVFYDLGAQVQEGAQLVAIETTSDES